MLKDKDGKEIPLKTIIDYLTGTDNDDMAKSVIDFSVYPVTEDKKVGDPTYYLVATEAIVTQISFMGPFTMIELDFRNIGVQTLQQVMSVINRFHSDINSDDLLMVSTITSLDHNATHVLSLMNPLVCVRGYSETGNGSTIMQLIYATENVVFSLFEIDYKQIDADIERQVRELESMQVTEEALAAAQEVVEDEYDDGIRDMFTPEFGFKTTEDKLKKNLEGIRSSTDRISSRKNTRIGTSEELNEQEIESDDDEDEVPENRV